MHKRLSKNVMITKPLYVSNNCYSSELLLDEYCDEMNDHVTGQHIQGMVIVEAARQMMISVSERFLLADEQRGVCCFILNDIETRCSQMAFPLQVHISCHLVSVSHSKCGISSCKMSFHFIQSGQDISKITIDFSARSSATISKIESSYAQQIINKSLVHESTQRQVGVLVAS